MLRPLAAILRTGKNTDMRAARVMATGADAPDRKGADQMSHDPLVLRSLLVPAQDLAESIRFYQGQLGLPLQFQDGGHYAELVAGPLKFALATADDHPHPTSVLPTFKTTDVQATAERLRLAGATILAPPRQGPHEIRAVLGDPAGIPFAIYASRR